MQTTHRTAPPRKRRRSCLWPALALFSLLFAGALLAAAALLLVVPGQAARTYGPPAAGLSTARVSVYSTLLLVQSGDLSEPVDPDGQPQKFEVQTSESAASIINRLWRAGLISNPAAFRTLLQYTGLDTSLQAGEYRLSPRMTPLEIAYALQDPTPGEVSLAVLAGWRIDEIAASIPSSGLQISSDDFLSAARSVPPGFEFAPQIPAGGSLEGFLFPDTYVVSRTLPAEALVGGMLENFSRQLTPDLRQGFEQQGLNVFEALTLASIVAREAVITEDMPLIASVFYNRLAIGMKLDSDPTVQYALGYNPAQETWWTNPLSLDDLKFNSPYNTYVYPGLPPGPIANPGPRALQAVAYPAQTPYYFFRAGCDGSGRHLFAETFEEHLQNACP